MSELTLDQLKTALPKQLQRNASQELVDTVNNLSLDPEFRHHYRDNIVGYAHVLQQGRFKLADYLNAVRYASFKMMGKTNIAAYTAAFPDKIQDFTDRGVSAKDISSYCTAYHKTKLVTLLLEQAMIPAWLSNQDVFQQAINTQAELMMTAKSEKVRSDAANSLLTHLKAPEANKIELEVTQKTDPAMQSLHASIRELSAAQRQGISQGQFNAQEVAHTPLVIEHEDE